MTCNQWNKSKLFSKKVYLLVNYCKVVNFGMVNHINDLYVGYSWSNGLVLAVRSCSFLSPPRVRWAWQSIQATENCIKYSWHFARQYKPSKFGNAQNSYGTSQLFE